MDQPVEQPGPTLYRVELREKCASVLKAANTLARQNVFTARSWPASQDILPSLWLSAPSDDGVSAGRSGPQFTRIANIEIRCLVSAKTPDAAMQQLDDAGGQIEAALFTNIDLIAMIQQVSSIRSETEINSDNATHIGVLHLRLGLEYTETWALSGDRLHSVSGQMVSGAAPKPPPEI